MTRITQTTQEHLTRKDENGVYRVAKSTQCYPLRMFLDALMEAKRMQQYVVPSVGREIKEEQQEGLAKK